MTINLERLRENAAQLMCIKPLIAVVKADAYGLGASKIASALDGVVHSFAVWTSDEAERLRECVKSDILVLGQSNRKPDINGVIYTVFSKEEAAEITGNRVAVKINTGMNRLGADILSLRPLVNKLRRRRVEVDSVYTHLFCTDDNEITNNQLRLFDDATNGMKIPRHVAASGALVYDFASKRYDMIRCGFALYVGVAVVRAKVIKVRKLRRGDYVGYGKVRLTKDTIVAVINIGYGDGYRQLSAPRYVFLNGEKCRVICVCMDVSIIDIVTELPKVGDFAEIVGSNITQEMLGESYRTSAYEAYMFYGRMRKIYVG